MTSPSPRAALPLVGRPVAPPPFRLPAAHFTAALAWLVCSAVLLLRCAPSLARGDAFAPTVFALVHAIMLGVIGSMITGTLFQFIPGGLGVPLPYRRRMWVGYWLYQGGLVLLIVGFLGWRGTLQGAGWLAVVAALLINNVPMVVRAWRGTPRDRTVPDFLLAGLIALGGGVALAAVRIGETVGWWQTDRLSVLGAHLLLGGVGFGSLSAIGVSSRMLPTFLDAPGDDARTLRIMRWSVAAGLLVYATATVAGVHAGVLAGGALLVVGGVAACALGGRWWFGRRRALDSALWAIPGALLALVTTVGLGGWLLLSPEFVLARWTALVAAMLPGWLLMLVVGVAAKLIPHMSYMRLAPTMPGFAAAGNPNRLLHPMLVRFSAVAFTAGWMLLVVALLIGDSRAARAASIVWSGGVAATLLNYGRMYVRGRWPAQSPAIAAGRINEIS